MPKRDLTDQNAKEATYYGLMMVVSFLVYFVLNRVIESSNALPDFLTGFATAIFIVSSVFTIIKYIKARKEPHNAHLGKAKLFAGLALIFWILVLMNMSRELLNVFGSLN